MRNQGKNLRKLRLAKPQVVRFYNLWGPLLEFINQETGLVSQDEMNDVFNTEAPETEYHLRAALWENIGVLEKFIEQNPADLKAEDLMTISAWRDFRYGRFTVTKVVYQMGIFVSYEEPYETYAVSPLNADFRDILAGIPLMIQTAFIPYENVLVYDGNFGSFPIRFGSGLRQRMENWYVDAKERNRIITSFSPSPPLTIEERIRSVERTNKSVLRHFKSYLKAEKLNERVIERDITTVTRFAAFLLNSQEDRFSLRDVSMDLLNQFLYSEEINRLIIVGLKRLFEFFWESERIHGELTEDLLIKLRIYQA